LLLGFLEVNKVKFVRFDATLTEASSANTLCSYVAGGPENKEIYVQQVMTMYLADSIY